MKAPGGMGAPGMGSQCAEVEEFARRIRQFAEDKDWLSLERGARDLLSSTSKILQRVKVMLDLQREGLLD